MSVPFLNAGTVVMGLPQLIGGRQLALLDEGSSGKVFAY
jgi:hypothetical protein